MKWIEIKDKYKYLKEHITELLQFKLKCFALFILLFCFALFFI